MNISPKDFLNIFISLKGSLKEEILNLKEVSVICPICISTVETIVRVPCGHDFCKECFKNYISYFLKSSFNSLETVDCPLSPNCSYKMGFSALTNVLHKLEKRTIYRSFEILEYYLIYLTKSKDLNGEKNNSKKSGFIKENLGSQNDYSIFYNSNYDNDSNKNKKNNHSDSFAFFRDDLITQFFYRKLLSEGKNESHRGMRYYKCPSFSCYHFFLKNPNNLLKNGIISNSHVKIESPLPSSDIFNNINNNNNNNNGIGRDDYRNEQVRGDSKIHKYQYCENCGEKSCIACGDFRHSFLTCTQNRAFKEKVLRKEDLLSAVFISSNTTRCPQCNVRMMRDKGCNHMKCMDCRFEFCWSCKKEWKLHSDKTGGYYRCFKSKIEEMEKSKRDDEVGEGKIGNDGREKNFSILRLLGYVEKKDGKVRRDLVSEKTSRKENEILVYKKFYDNEVCIKKLEELNKKSDLGKESEPSFVEEKFDSLDLREFGYESDSENESLSEGRREFDDEYDESALKEGEEEEEEKLFFKLVRVLLECKKKLKFCYIFLFLRFTDFYAVNNGSGNDNGNFGLKDSKRELETLVIDLNKNFIDLENLLEKFYDIIETVSIAFGKEDGEENDYGNLSVSLFQVISEMESFSENNDYECNTSEYAKFINDLCEDLSSLTKSVKQGFAILNEVNR